MNFALSGIIIIVLLLPGAITLKAFYSGFKSKESSRSIPLSDLLVKGCIFSLAIHVTILCLISMLNYKIDFHFFYNILIGNPSKDFRFSDVEFDKYAKHFISYILISILFGWISAKFIRSLVKKLRWNVTTNAFRNYNFWFYFFSNEYAEGGRKEHRPETDLIYVDVMTNLDVIYCGFLIDFNYSPDKDELENIVLEGAKRRVVDKLSAQVSEPIPVLGDMLIINMKDVLNINVKFIDVSDIDENIAEPPIEPTFSNQKI